MADVDMYTDSMMYTLPHSFVNGGLCMPKLIDRTGQRFGKLVVLEKGETNNLKKVLWKCFCDCGNTTLVVSGSLSTGNTSSCGCGVKEAITKHGGWKKASYNTWRAMMRRCNNPNDKDYKRYGAVGVKVCHQWQDYRQFEKDMGEPQGNETLDRIDVYGDYEPSNCRWATPTVQNRNVRVRKDSKSGHVGVRMRYGKWIAEITSKRKKFYSQMFDKIEDAVSARKQLELLHWGLNGNTA